MNAIIYARYSSHGQQETSIDGQLKYCYEYAKNNGYTVIEEYIDRAKSATTDNRPEFLRMIEDSKKKQFNIVLVYQLDRFSRDRYDSATYKAKLKKNSVKVISVRENISDDASGILMESVLEGMAEYYSKELSQKVVRGMSIAGERCQYLGGRPPLGYAVGVDKRFTIAPDTAPHVVKIFEMYASGHTIVEIINYLNKLGLKTAMGNKFNKNSLRHILMNKKYIGIYTFKGKDIPDGVPKIVSEELFYQVQEILDKNKKAPARARAKMEYLLTTKLFCGYDKEMMVGISGNSRSGEKFCYYSCKNVIHRKGCHKKNVRKEWIEDFVLSKARAQLTNEHIEFIANEVEKKSKTIGDTPEVKRISKLLRENDTAIENLLRALEIGNAADIITERISKKKEEQLTLKQSLAIEQLKNNTVNGDEVRFFLHSLQNGDANHIKYKRALIAIFIDKIFLYDDRITIFFHATDRPISIDYSLIDASQEETTNDGKSVSHISSPAQPSQQRNAGFSSRPVFCGACYFFVFQKVNCNQT